MDVSPLNSKSTNKPSKSKKLSSKQKKLILALVAILLVILAFCGVYKYSYNKGYKAGEANAKKNTASNAQDLIGNIQNPFKTQTGQVEKLEGETLTITNSKGETKTIKITNSTKITKKTETLNKDALTKGTKVTIFTSGEGDNLSATRVVVR